MASGPTLDDLVGLIRHPRDALEPLEGTLSHRAKDWLQYRGLRNNAGMAFRTELVVGRSAEHLALCARVDGVHYVVVFERLLLMIDDVFATLAGISDGEPMFGPDHSFDGMRLLHPPGFRFLSEAKGKLVSPGLDGATATNALTGAFLSHIALRFVVDHEYFHAFHGHVLFAEELFGRPVVSEVDRFLAGNELNMRRALELQADRSAFMQMLLDIVQGEVPTNEAVDRMTVDERLVLGIVAVLIVIGLMGAEEQALGIEPEINPAAERRASLLVSPTIERGLASAGFDAPRIKAIGAAVHHAAKTLASLHNVLKAPALAFDLDRKDYNSIENRRLEWLYFMMIGPLLRDRQFFPSNESFRTAERFSMKPDWGASVQKS